MIRCPKCAKRLNLEQIRSIIGGLPRDQLASLRGTINATMRETIGTSGGRKPTCECGTCVNCVRRAKRREKNAKATSG